MNQKNDQKGTKGTTGTSPFFPHMRVHNNADSVDGVNFDNDLDWVPDGEPVSEGSEPQTPLPTFCQEKDIWPRMLQSIVDHGYTPQQRDALSLLPAVEVNMREYSLDMAETWHEEGSFYQNRPWRLQVCS